jgi:hypothetical protein
MYGASIVPCIGLLTRASVVTLALVALPAGLSLDRPSLGAAPA